VVNAVILTKFAYCADSDLLYISNLRPYIQGYHRSRTKNKHDWGKFDFSTWN